MRLLLDTHALLWWWADDERLSPAARAAITDARHTVLVSAACAWEIATKQRIGKLPEWPLPPGGFDAQLALDGFQSLPVTTAHAWHAGRLDWPHRNPFDRMLAAQAQSERLTLVSCDAVFGQVGVPVLW